MRKHLIFSFFLVFSSLSFSQLEELEGTYTSQSAREYAANNIWSEVIILPKSECEWIVNVGETEERKPSVGDESVVRNTLYKLIVDTTITKVQCSVVDFNPSELSPESTDSLISLMIRDFNQLGSFEKVVEKHLTFDEMKVRYTLLNEDAGRLEEVYGFSFLDYRKGAIFTDENSSDGYKFLVFIRENPMEEESFVVLKTRVNNSQRE